MKEITKEELAALPIRRYEGRVVLNDTRELLQDIGNETLLGWDTETRPAFKPGQSYLPSLVQLATARAVISWPGICIGRWWPRRFVSAAGSRPNERA